MKSIDQSYDQMKRDLQELNDRSFSRRRIGLLSNRELIAERLVANMVCSFE